jgi:phosphoglycerate dehydrogenase-like enzyme
MNCLAIRDEAALAEALGSGKVDASLDVFSVEPPPAGSGCFAAEGVLVTPRPETRRQGYQLV